ncbi:MAG: hypothetical protein ACLFST_15130 [Spirochaetia bacterium]
MYEHVKRLVESMRNEIYGDDHQAPPAAPPSEPSAEGKNATFYAKAPKAINMRIDPHQFQQIKQHARLEGLPYQTFIKSVVFRYINGLLIPVPKPPPKKPAGPRHPLLE